MNRKVADFMARQQMVQPGDHVICAVSGGKDSVVLLHLLQALAPQWDLHITAAHLDHGLRGAESRRDAAFVQDLCQKLGIPLALEHRDVAAYAATQHLGLEEAARVLRYDFLLGLSPTAKIATAHTAQDNLETVLMHLLRGSGLHGLTGIPPVRGRIIRPLLTVSAQEMGDYLVAHDLPHVEDSTNALDDCLRNRLRHHVVPLLEHENPSLSAAVARTTDTLRLEDQYLEDQAQAALTQALVGTQLSRTGLLAAPPALQYRMLQQFLSPVSSLTTAHLEAALALAQGAAPNARYALPGGHTLVRQYDLLALERLAAPTGPLAAQPLTADCTFGPWHITCRPGPAPATLPPGTLALALSALTGPLALRPRQPGDRISLPGGTKKLSRLLMDEKIPASLRDTLPVVSMGDTVLAILPLRVAKDFTPGAGRDSLLLSATRMEDEPCTRI